MNVPLLKGGVCNQMFQIAAIYANCLKHNNEIAINYNLGFAAHQGYHPNRYKDNLYKNINTTEETPAKVYRNLGHQFVEIPNEKDLLIDGYFQSYKFFENYLDETKNLFYFTEEIKNKITKLKTKINKPLCIIHIRRGDYKVLVPHHFVCTKNYYLNCIDIIKEHAPDAAIAVITDDWQNVYTEFKSEFDSNKLIVANSSNEIEDLYLLSQADYIVGSNSSFSWWGSFLNDIKKLCLFPDVWFGPEGLREYGHPELYLKYMTKVNTNE